MRAGAWHDPLLQSKDDLAAPPIPHQFHAVFELLEGELVRYRRGDVQATGGRIETR